MAFSMRKSKFRHVFGKVLKREHCYEGIKPTKTTWERTFVAANPKFLAIVTESAGGGSFIILPLSKTGRIERDCPSVCGHKAAVLDLAWSPHDDNCIASVSEDGCLMVWDIPEGGITENLETPTFELKVHQKKVGLVIWHPTAENVLLTAGADNKIYLWSLVRPDHAEVLLEIDVPDQIWSASFNYNGSRIVTTCKDKILRVIDPRSGDVIAEQKCHEGSKPSMAVFLKNGQIFTTGFSRMSERQYALWGKDSLEKLCMEEIDNNNGVLHIFYDPDTDMLYLAAKGDSTVRFYEVTDESPYVHYLSLYTSRESQKCFGFQSKRALDLKEHEIAKMYKLQNNGLCEVIPFTVPRKSELFQDDIYPDTAAAKAAITADAWFKGEDCDPVKISLREKFESITGVSSQPTTRIMRKANLNVASTPKKTATPVVKKEEPPAPKPAPAPAKPTVTPTPSPAAAPAPAEPKPDPKPSRQSMDANQDSAASAASLPASSEDETNGNDSPTELKHDSAELEMIVRALKAKVEAQEEEIASLQKRVSALECANGDEN